MKELEFRTKEGNLKFSIVNGHSWFNRMLGEINNNPNFTKSVKTLGNDTRGYKKYVVFECIYPFGWIVSDFLSFTLNEGDYIKVISE